MNVGGVGDMFGPGFAGLNEEQRLEKTARELEAVLVTQLLATMRETVPEGGLFGKSMADDVFRSMLDEQIARATSEKSPFGLADAVVKSLQERVKNAGDSTESTKEGAGPAPADPRAPARWSDAADARPAAPWRDAADTRPEARWQDVENARSAGAPRFRRIG